nr:hypothetical protein [Mesorhizobium sp.]
MQIFLAASGLLLCAGPMNIIAHAQGQSIQWRSEATFAKDAKPRKSRSGGLAGSEGDVKRKIMFTGFTQGGCKGLYKRYVAASGHSAYAATTIDYFAGGAYVCAAGLNAGSQAEAERRAVAECKRSREKYKTAQPSGPCVVYASK